MKKKSILILGAGMSGLSAAWHLSQKSPYYDCTVLEKKERPGGWMHSDQVGEFLVEGGPRVFKTSRNKDLLNIVEEIDFRESLIESSPEAEKRFLFLDGKLQKMPGGLISLIRAPFCRPLLFSLIKEMKVPSYHADETIWDFACRRFGKVVAERFFDPLISGIYAGDIKTLSVSACLAPLKRWERERGSVVKGMLSSLFKKKKKAPLKGSLFSFEKGTGSFVNHWIEKAPFPVYFQEEALFLEKKKGKWVVHTSQGVREADAVIFALPAYKAADLLEKEIAPKSAQILQDIFYEDVTSIHLGWKEDVLPISAFGYLVPSVEKQPILGTLFDSKIFSRGNSLTSITVMARGTFHADEEIEEIARRVWQDHLQIQQIPVHLSWKKMERAIPQYTLGHQEKVEDLLCHINEEAPGLYLTGSYLDGVSVNDCIKQAKEMVDTHFPG